MFEVQSLPPTCGHPGNQEYNSDKWSLCTSPQNKVDKELDGQEEIGLSFGWNCVYINICIQSLPNARSYVYMYICTYIYIAFI